MSYRYERPVTPAELSPALRALISAVVPSGTAEYVDVNPIVDAPPDECFGLVDARVAVGGGQAVLGWTLWELPGVFVEAEFHCVWRAPGGALVDVAPKKTPTVRILFLADPGARYEGRSGDNVRRALNGDPAVAAYLRTFHDMFLLTTRGERAGQHGEIRLVGEEAREYAAIQAQRSRLWAYVGGLVPAAGAYHPCPCGSGKKVRWCCGARV